MFLETPHAVANIYRKLLINAQTWQFCPGASCQHQTTSGKKIAFPMNKVKFDSPLSNRVLMSLEEQELQTAHFNAAVPPSRPVLGLCEGTWYRCTKKRLKPR